MKDAYVIVGKNMFWNALEIAVLTGVGVTLIGLDVFTALGVAGAVAHVTAALKNVY